MATVRCPGCDKLLVDFMRAPAHYADAEDMRRKKGEGNSNGWPYTNDIRPLEDNRQGKVCSWDRDYLVAEWFRQHPEMMSPSTAADHGSDTITDPETRSA